eukprot:GHVQ01041472.1.p1 GENE.GHVQ01041472.1~~GHVQ01041472.1.p1  ORF type:complete len:1149 (+),score=211.66 GHVQ01041472.1:1902-5348(+)
MHGTRVGLRWYRRTNDATPQQSHPAAPLPSASSCTGLTPRPPPPTPAAYAVSPSADLRRWVNLRCKRIETLTCAEHLPSQSPPTSTTGGEAEEGQSCYDENVGSGTEGMERPATVGEVEDRKGEADTVEGGVKEQGGVDDELEGTLADLRRRVKLTVIDGSMIDEGLIGKRLLYMVRHARRRLAVEKPMVLPSRACLYIAGVSLEMQRSGGMDWSSAQEYRWFPTLEKLCLDEMVSRDFTGVNSPTVHLITEPVQAFEFDFQAPLDRLDDYIKLRDAKTLHLPVIRAGTVNAIVAWFDLYRPCNLHPPPPPSIPSPLALSLPREPHSSHPPPSSAVGQADENAAPSPPQCEIYIRAPDELMGGSGRWVREQCRDAGTVGGGGEREGCGKARATNSLLWHEAVQWVDNVEVSVGQQMVVEASHTPTRMRFMITSPIKSPVNFRQAAFSRWQLDFLNDHGLQDIWNSSLQQTITSRLERERTRELSQPKPVEVLNLSCGAGALALYALRAGAAYLSYHMGAPCPEFHVTAADPLLSQLVCTKGMVKREAANMIEDCIVERGDGVEGGVGGGERGGVGGVGLVKGGRRERAKGLTWLPLVEQGKDTDGKREDNAITAPTPSTDTITTTANATGTASKTTDNQPPSLSASASTTDSTTSTPATLTPPQSTTPSTPSPTPPTTPAPSSAEFPTEEQRSKLHRRISLLRKDVRQLRPPEHLITAENEIAIAQALGLPMQGGTLKDQLPSATKGDYMKHKPSIVTGNVFDCGGLGEGVLPLLSFVWEALAEKDSSVVPGKMQMFGMGVELGGEEVEGVDVKIWGTYRYQADYGSIDLSRVVHKQLTEPVEIFAFNFSRKSVYEASTKAFQEVVDFALPVIDSGRLNAFIFWFELNFSDSLPIVSTAPFCIPDSALDDARLQKTSAKFRSKLKKSKLTVCSRKARLTNRELHLAQPAPKDSDGAPLGTTSTIDTVVSDAVGSSCEAETASVVADASADGAGISVGCGVDGGEGVVQQVNGGGQVKEGSVQKRAVYRSTAWKQAYQMVEEFQINGGETLSVGVAHDMCKVVFRINKEEVAEYADRRTGVPLSDPIWCQLSENHSKLTQEMGKTMYTNKEANRQAVEAAIKLAVDPGRQSAFAIDPQEAGWFAQTLFL